MTDFIRALRRTIIGALLMGVFVVVSIVAPKAEAAPGINQQMNFQGRLLTSQGATVPDGYYNMQFKIYQDGTGTVAGNPSGTLKWTESWLNTESHGVQVKNGYMSLQLGSITSLSSVDWNQDTLWLSINVGNTNTTCTPFTSCSGDGEMLPMKRLSSTPYAFNAGKLAGLSAAQFLQLAQGVQTEAGTNTSSIAINKTGTGGNFLNLQASGVDVFSISNAGDITFGNNVDHSIAVTTAAANTAGTSLSISGGTAGTGASALTGGNLTLQGGNGGGTGGNGGNLVLDAGAAASGGTGGTVIIGGTNASSISLGQDTVVTAGNSLTIAGGTTGTRPSSPTEGMIYYDTDTKQLLVYSNGKWQADRSDASKIVAANNSSAAQKTSADYVASGTNDHTTIQSALDAAAGGKIYLLEGTYNVTDTIKIPNNTALVGAGRNTLIQLGNINGQTKNVIEQQDTGTTTPEGITIRDLRIDGDSTTNATGTMHGIALAYVGGGSGSTARNGATISNVHVLNMRTYGIYLNNSPNGTLTGNTIQGNAGTGIYMSASNRLNVTNNTIQSNAGSGIWLAGSQYDVISANNIITNGGAGIGLNGSSANNTISDNNLYNNTGSSTNSSISLASSNSNHVTSNTINDTAGTGYAISVDSASATNYLSDNIFSGTGATSISDASATTTYANQSRAANGGQLTNRTTNNGEAFTVQNATGANIFAVDTTNSQVTLGNASTAGKLTLSDGSSNTGTIVVGALSGNYTYTIPTTAANDSFCLVTLNNCAADSTLFIQNQNAAAQATANYWISGTGRADGGIATTTVDTATSSALSLGTTTATGVTIGRSSTVTTINGKLAITLDTTDGTTITCQNPSGYLSVCDSSVLTPSAANFIQNGTTLQTAASFWIDGTGKATGGFQSNSIDALATGNTLSLGTGNAGAVTIGKTATTTTIQGNIGVTLNATTGTTQVCRNGTGLLSSCDASFLAPTTTNFIQNQSGTAQTGDFNISGTGTANTLQAANVVTPSIDTATATALNIGTTNATAINLNQNVTVAAGKSLTLAGGNTASRPASPSEGALYFDTDTDQLLVYSNGKWQADRSTATKIVAASNASQAVKDSADYVADGTSDQAEINAALTAAAGGKVYLTEGMYTINASISVPNNTTLAGAGAGTVITIPNAFDININAITNTTTGGNGTGINIHDLRLEGNRINQASGNMNAIYFNGVGSGGVQGGKITNVWVNGWLGVGGEGGGIRLLSSSGNNITEVTVQSSYMGITVNNGSNNDITGNILQNNSYGIHIAGTGSNNTVSGNDIQSNVHGIVIDTNSNNVITGNSLQGNSSRGIGLVSSQNNTVAGNNFSNNGGNTTNSAIYLDATDGNTITGNNITDSSATTTNYAINISNITSDANYLANNTLGGGSINDAGNGTVYGGQVNASDNFVIQPAGTIELQKNTNVTGTLSASTSLLSPSLDRATAGTLSIGTNATNTTAITIGSGSITTTIQGNTGVTLNATTGTTIVCRNASGVLSTCDAGYLAPTATNFIQNGTSQQASSNFNISGTGVASTLQASTSVLTPLLDTATAVALNIGTTNTTAINLNENVVVAADKTLTITGGSTRPGSPTEGMVWYDTTTHELLRWNGTKWVSNGNDAYLVAASNSSQADKDAADYVATGTGDQSTIQSALDRADPASAVSGARKSGKVYLFAGTYTTSDVISIPNDTTLSGAGRGSVIKFANINGQTRNMITNTDTTTGRGVTVRDLQLDGSNSVNTSGTMHGMYFNGMGGGAGSTARQGANIIGTWVINFYTNGIYLNSSPNSVVMGNNVQGNTGNGIYISSSNRANITNNISQGNSGSGIVLGAAISENISGNTFAANNTAGVYLNGGSNNNIISTNNFYNNGGATTNNAIFAPASANADYNTITNNSINDTAGSTSNYAINFADNTSNGNYLADNVFVSTLGTSTINDPSGTGTLYANQSRAEGGARLTNRTANDTEAFAIQNASGTNILAIDTTNGKVLVGNTLDTTGTSLNIGTTSTTTALTIGNVNSTTTIAGNTGVTLNATTGTAMVCRNASGYLSACDATYLTPTATNFIQNGTGLQTANFNISGTGQAVTLTAATVNATTSLVTSTVDAGSATTLTLGGTTASGVSIGKTSGTTTINSNTVTVGSPTGATTIGGAAQTTNNTAGSDLTIRGSAGLGTGNGGLVTLQGGNAGASGTTGGNLVLSGGTGTTTNGLVVLGTSAFQTATTDASCYPSGTESTTTTNCTITQNSINNNAAVLVGFTNENQTANMPDPVILTTAGRVVYVTASNLSKDFTLSVNGGGTGNQIAMRKNTTATMIWNGADWTAAGASSSTTLQAAYDNTLQSAGGAELVVSKTTATNGLTIRDSATNSVNGALLNVQSSSAANLFSVNSNVTEYAKNSGAETYGANVNTFPASTWATVASPTSTVTRYITAGDNIATGQASVSIATPATANAGAINTLSTSLTANMTYNVSFSTRLASGTFTDMTVYYSINGTTQSVLCATGQTARTSIWTKVNCTFQAPASGITATNAILIQQASGVARTFYVDNLSVTIAADYNYAGDGDVDDSGMTSWSYTTGTGTGTVTRTTTDGYNASSSATATITAGAANAGMRNRLAISPLANTLYRVSVYAKAAASFTDFKVRYSPDNGTSYVDCVDYNTQTLTTTSWTQVTCYVKTSATASSNPYIYFVETASAVRTYSVDAFSMTLASNTTPNVQIGSGSNGGPTTLFTLDKGASAPIAANNDALLGSMYYDTTLGKLQCYEADGWGACGSSPDNIVTISPEYTNAVMHGTGVGTMTSDICSDALDINDPTNGPAICSSNETYNFYKWTSPQATSQAYSIYVTYQLPTTFKEFASGQTSVQARVDNTSNAAVQLQIFKNHSGLTSCGGNVTLTTAANTWQAPVASGTADPSTCGFAGGDSIVFKITLNSRSNANAYIGNLNFTFSNR
jgi:parallel beta-helix repeat protein